MNGGILALFLIMVYFLPAIVARCRDHNDIGAIVILNLIFGWTIIGWFIALTWSATGNIRRL